MGGQDPLRYFRIEARELVDQISAGVLDLDQQPGPDLVARLLRFAHTLKGAARVVKQQEIADRAHEFEEVLVPHRDENTPSLPADQMRELLRLNDEIAGHVRALSGEPAAEPEHVRTVPLNAPTTQAEVDQAHIDADYARGAEASADRQPERAATADLDELLDAIGEASARIAPLRDGSRTLARVHRKVEALGERMRLGRMSVSDSTARTAVRRLGGEIGALGRRLTDAVDQVERELDEVRGRAEGLRLVPAGTIFTALRRAVRDAADAEGKQVQFQASGADVRMGPYLLNLINGAFLHVVRNAVVHGIEPEPERRAAGKPVEGTVTVHVERRGRYAEFRCSDDGRGFDLAALRRTAEERGLLPTGSDADSQKLIDLVLHGGISTAPAVTEVAGRGIGMDVARDVAVQLGGEVSIENRPGDGATVRLIVPLTLLSMNGLIVETGTMTATMPLDSVRRCVRLSAGEMAAATATARLAHEGEVLPFLPLATALRATPPDKSDSGSGVAIVLAADRDTVAIGVDRLAGTTTLVARPLPDLAPAAPVIGSVSIDLDGNPRLVLDAHGLVAEARHESTAARSESAAVPRSRMPILVVDDSLTTRQLERSILESAGYEVDLAASGEEGLEKARARAYGLYLTDIDMPGIDGFTFVERTRADPALAPVPAILVSSRASAEDRRRGTDVGASAYVVKGEFNQEELLAHIRRLIL
ncbi:hybrid sensor histidine kinase/response regulator [Actinoplanes solisilvae]|uniref:hybrid sensor histidine kinase/response regulator n=1 Tax=Actinoplanes solisilvae TaxID=2486853 RepID=UPI001F0CB549|nr:response regulator [Actinoplanes solisilvae]